MGWDDATAAFVSPEVTAMFRQMNDKIQLNHEIQRTEGERWRTCDLMVEPRGKFRSSLSFDPPKQISIVSDDDLSTQSPE